MRSDFMIRLHFEKLSRYERLGEPCSCAIPFPKGELFDITKAAISDGENFYPVQCKITAQWPDHSVKWLFITFLADLPGNLSKDYYFIPDARKYDTHWESWKNALSNQITIEEKNKRLEISTGELRVQLTNPGEAGLFHKIETKDKTYHDHELKGPILINDQDQEFILQIGQTGWRILEQGPIVSILETKGKHYSNTKKDWFDFKVRIQVFAGKPWLQIDYTIINKEKEKEEKLRGIEYRIKVDTDSTSKIRTALATSNYTSKIIEGSDNQKLYHLIDANQLVYEANEHIPETFYGTFWADWRMEGKGGICATLYQAHQNFPKAMEVDQDGMTIKILPKEAFDLTLIQGMAKTHQLYLHFHGAEDTLQSLNVRSLQMQLKDRPVLDTHIYKKSGVFDPIFVTTPNIEVERALVAKADERGKAYGILHWGDAPDPGYTQQGRGNGDPVWTNNEYDFPHAMMQMYARTSERRMLDYMLVATRHWMDVDFCHYSPDPLRHHAQITHSANHVTGDVEISHEWVEGLLDYYHMTGEVTAYETAIAIGENILYHLSQPRYHKKGEINARETGWALRSLVALYKETYDEAWLASADMIVGHFEAWKEEYGGWLSPYTDHTAIRVPFMISIAVGSLMRYYRVKPQDRIKNMIIDAVKDMVDHCYQDHGLFYYKELPSLRRLGNNTLVLEALVNAYELTGDKNFLNYGLATFYEAIKYDRGRPGFLKQVKKDAIIIQGPGPKGFAQSFYPLVTYYVAATKTGILQG